MPLLEFFVKKYFFATIQIFLLYTGRKIFCSSNVSMKTIRIRTFSFTFLPTCCCFQSCWKRIISLHNFSECSQNSGVLQVQKQHTWRSQESYNPYNIQDLSDCKETVYFATLVLIPYLQNDSPLIESNAINDKCGLKLPQLWVWKST